MLNLECHRVTRVVGSNGLDQGSAIRSRLGVDLEDDVPDDQTCLLGWTPRGDDHYDRTGRAVAKLDAHVGPTGIGHLAATDELIRDHLGAVAGDGEADARSASADLRVRGRERRDADDVALEVNQRATAVARIDCSARLDDVRS